VYFTDCVGILYYAFHWGTTYCEVKVPRGIEVSEQSGNIYKAKLIRLGKVKPLNGEFIAGILHTLHSSGELDMRLIGELMYTLRLEMKLDFVDVMNPNKYQITKTDQELADCFKTPTKPHTKYQLKTYYKLTDDDYEAIINALKSILNVDLIVKKQEQKPAGNADKNSSDSDEE